MGICRPPKNSDFFAKADMYNNVYSKKILKSKEGRRNLLCAMQVQDFECGMGCDVVKN